jgi:putative hydrolase of the HAD superfamily
MKKYASISRKKMSYARSKAKEYIDAHNTIVTESEEYSAFLEYYRAFFISLPELSISDEAIKSITKDLVYNHEKYMFYSDVKDVIPKLSEKYKLAIISDACLLSKMSLQKQD